MLDLLGLVAQFKSKINIQMKKFPYMLPALLLMVSCGGENNKPVSESSQVSDTHIVASASIEGQWLLEHVVVNDTVEVRPAADAPEVKLYAYFYNDSTFNFQTGCNAIGGRYVQAGDSIILADMLCTEMACEDMRVEEILKAVLPQVKTVDWSNDSIIRLNTPASAYIVLKQCNVGVKCVEPD